MYQKMKKLIAVFCALALVVSVIPVQAKAAVKPKFEKKYTSLYENDSKKGVYTYKVINLTKGQTVKWSVSGTGKKYVKLKSKSTKVTKKSVTNKLTVKTGGKTAAKNKTVKLTAKVYSKAGKLQYTLTTASAKIKINPTKIQITDDGAAGGKFLVGKSYQFKYKVTPANATSTNEWKAMDEDGNALPDMTKKGVFTPSDDGNYTIVVQAKNGSKIIKSASCIVTVSNTMISVKQTAANKIVAVFSSSAKNQVKQSDFSIKNAVGVASEIQSMSFSGDGKEVTLTTKELLKEGTEYTVTDGAMSHRFTAHIGQPEELVILTKEVTVNKETNIDYALYDQYGIDVKAACKKTAVINDDYQITNGMVKDNKIIMQRAGDTGKITMTYADSDNGILLTASATIICVAATTSDDTNFTLTTSDKTPDYSVLGYKDNRKAAAGETYYAHFCARDDDGSEINYDSLKFESSDPDTLVVNNQSNGPARITAVKPGTVNIVVTAVYAKQEYTYSYEVTVVEASYLQGLKLDKYQLEISNSGAAGYREYIQVQGMDQYGEVFPLENETAVFTDNSTYKTNLVTYDAASHRIVVDAAYKLEGTYQYTLTITMGNRKVSGNFVIVVKSPSANGAVSYQVQIDRPVLDLAIGSATKKAELVNEKTATVRLAEYRGGVFYNYVMIQSAQVTKDGVSYGNDLTKGASSATVTAGNQVALAALSLDGNKCTKAQTGTYVIELKFYRTDSSSSGLATVNAGLQITDSQTAPAVKVKHTTASKACTTALELAKDCLEVTGVSGEIVNCEITGETAGGSFKLSAGESINIKSVTVQTEVTLADGEKIVMNYVLPVGKTLKNA